LDCLIPLLGRERVESWKHLARSGQWDELVADCWFAITTPPMAVPSEKNYARAASGPGLTLTAPDPETVRALASRFLSDLA
jgi:hypothetical protein